jgi:anti-sigma regulatory factor (Ser/Thr protein kinase)
VRETQPTDGVAGVEAVDAGGDHFEGPGELLYECMLPALPGSVFRMQHELTAALARHLVAADRRADMELVFTEAASNAVVHAYRWHGAGPLYAAASLAGGAVVVWVSDAGRGMRRGSGSPGAGFGLLLMRELADDLRICCDPDQGGKCVQATFERATARDADSRVPDRAELLQEYLRVQREVTASLRDETQAVLAQARQAVAHARRRQRERADVRR